MTGFVHSSHRTKLSFDLNDAHGNSWNRFFLSFSSRAGIEFQGQQSSSSSASALYSFARLGKALVGAPAALPPLSRTRGKKKKKRSGRSTRRPILPRTEIKSNVQRPFPIPFPFFSFPDPSHFCPASPLPLSLSSPLLQNSCTLGQIARIRLHRPNNTDSTTTAQSKIGPM